MEHKRPDFRIVSSYEQAPVDYIRRDPIIILRERLDRSTIDRIGDWLESDLAVGIYVGIYIGCMITVAAALLWSFAS